MNKDNLERIKNELEQELEENEEKLEVYNERAIISENNQFQIRIMGFVCHLYLSYFNYIIYGN